jgi:hypothetical protein
MARSYHVSLPFWLLTTHHLIKEAMLVSSRSADLDFDPDEEDRKDNKNGHHHNSNHRNGQLPSLGPSSSSSKWSPPRRDDDPST